LNAGYRAREVFGLKGYRKLFEPVETPPDRSGICRKHFEDQLGTLTEIKVAHKLNRIGDHDGWAIFHEH